MSRLQRAPTAWLGALDLKVGGQNPTDVEDKVSPSLEMGNFYWQPLTTQNTSASVAGLISGTSLVLTVPAGQNWLVYAIAGDIGIHAGDVISDQWASNLAYRENANAVGSALAVSEAWAPRTIVADCDARVAVKFDYPFLAPSGAQFTLASNGRIVSFGVNQAMVLSVVAFVFKN